LRHAGIILNVKNVEIDGLIASRAILKRSRNLPLNLVLDSVFSTVLDILVYIGFDFCIGRICKWLVQIAPCPLSPAPQQDAIWAREATALIEGGKKNRNFSLEFK